MQTVCDITDLPHTNMGAQRIEHDADRISKIPFPVVNLSLDSRGDWSWQSCIRTWTADRRPNKPYLSRKPIKLDNHTHSIY